MSNVRGAFPALLVVLAAVAVHAVTLGHGYVWDDERVVAGPTTLREALLGPDEVAPYYRPLTRASFLVDQRVFGLDPRASHALNVGLHALAVLLLYLLGTRLFGETLPAAGAALLLAVHPVHVEAVAFVTARNNLLALVFALDAVLLYLRGKPALAAGAAFLALCGKEQGGIAVLVILACWALQRPRGSWRTLMPLAAAVGAYLVLRAVALHGAPVAPMGDVSVPAALSGIGEILRLVVWPAGLTIFHREPVPSWADLLPWAVLCALAAWLLRRPAPAARVGVAWLAFGLLPLLGLVPIPSATVAERYVYAVLPGLWLLLAEAARRAPPRMAWPVAAVVLLALSARTVDRVRDWRDDVALARAAVEVDSGSAPARFNLGVALKDAGDLARAEREWTEALRLDPADAEAMTQLGTAAAVRGDLAQAEALLRRARELRPDLAIAAFNLARICERTGREEEARRLYRTFLEHAGEGERELIPQARERMGGADSQ